MVDTTTEDTTTEDPTPGWSTQAKWGLGAGIATVVTGGVGLAYILFGGNGEEEKETKETPKPQTEIAVTYGPLVSKGLNEVIDTYEEPEARPERVTLGGGETGVLKFTRSVGGKERTFEFLYMGVAGDTTQSIVGLYGTDEATGKTVLFGAYTGDLDDLSVDNNGKIWAPAGNYVFGAGLDAITKEKLEEKLRARTAAGGTL